MILNGFNGMLCCRKEACCKVQNRSAVLARLTTETVILNNYATFCQFLWSGGCARGIAFDRGNPLSPLRLHICEDEYVLIIFIVMEDRGDDPVISSDSLQACSSPYHPFCSFSTPPYCSHACLFHGPGKYAHYQVHFNHVGNRQMNSNTKILFVW